MNPCTLVDYLSTLSKVLQEIKCSCITRYVSSPPGHVERILDTADGLVKGGAAVARIYGDGVSKMSPQWLQHLCT